MKGIKKGLFGILFILGAIAIVLEQAEVINIGFSIVDGIITIILGLIFVESVTKLHFFPMLVSLAGIAVVFSEQLGLEKLTPWPILIAAGLAGIGLSIIFEGTQKKCKKNEERKFIEETINNEKNIVNINTSFGAATKYITNKDLEKVTANIKFGAVKIYLDKASLKNNKAILDLSVSFGGVELYIPKDWKVTNNVSASLGGLDEKNQASAKLSDNELVITGSISFSGVEIIYV